MREVWLSTLLFGFALAAFEAILVYVFPKILEESAGLFLQIRFFRNFLKGLLGVDVGAEFGPQMMSAFPWVHPVVFVVVWAHAITLGTRTPAGEVDRGTIDVLMSLPVTRTGLYVSVSLVCLGAGLTLIACGLAGNLVAGVYVAPDLRTPPGRILIVIANLIALYVAVAGITMMVSAGSDRRGRAVGIVFAIMLCSFFLNFLAQFWEPAKAVAFLSMLNYYQPLMIVRDGTWPVRDIVVLSGVGATAWLFGGIWFARRDICTV